ncbi:MAG: glycosyltransferase [Xanthomarina sp.]
MKILLIGEYSRLHNSLKEGLQKLGHEVVLVGNGDHFKHYPVDILIDSPISNRYIPEIIKKGIHRLFKIDVCDYEKLYRLKKQMPKLKNFDTVQLINEDAFSVSPKFQIKYLRKLIEQNKNIFLLSCGEDFTSISHYLKGIEKYSILTPYLQNPSLKKQYHFSLKYQTKPFEELHHFIYKNIKGVIASDMDYHLPLKEHRNYLGLIPNPVNTDNFNFTPLNISKKINIFHGVNIKNYIKKGNGYFDEALNLIASKYPEKVDIVRTENLPYNIYIEKYNEAHIILDQVFSYDQGYNALEAMAQGKVVFTGAEKEWLEYYNLEEDTVAINALPDAEKIAKKLEWLILHPEKILEISRNARDFIEKEHNYILSAKKYLETWESNC